MAEGKGKDSERNTQRTNKAAWDEDVEVEHREAGSEGKWRGLLSPLLDTLDAETEQETDALSGANDNAEALQAAMLLAGRIKDKAAKKRNQFACVLTRERAVQAFHACNLSNLQQFVGD